MKPYFEWDDAARELRIVETMLKPMGALPELDITRVGMRSVNQRPSRNDVVPGGPLSEKETRVAELVGQRKGNKEIALMRTRWTEPTPVISRSSTV